MNYTIQHLVLPSEEKHMEARELFYHGDEGSLDAEKRTLSLEKGQKVDFTTYLNACSYRKWKKYTIAGTLMLTLDLKGQAVISYVGYRKDKTKLQRTEYKTERDERTGRRETTFTYPENDEQILGFELTALDVCVIHGGYFSAEVDERKLNPVELCLATTTMKKEAYIKKNVALLQSEILNTDMEIAKHFYIHVVDNGRTLTEDDIHGKHVFLHPNTNAGGSGGYARGMIECLHQTPEATNVLLMDDDVLVLPESIIRTYHLLRLQKPEYRDHFISGAMLYFEEPKKQHEDIGTVRENGYFQSLKPKFDQTKLWDNITNEEDYPKSENEFAAWWYCCIPMTMIKRHGLPLPLFIRFDDVEYSLRCQAQFITMNGICIWHMGFALKYNPALVDYQERRNQLIDQSVTGVLKNVNAVEVLYKAYRVELLKLNYDAASLVLKAFEDYMRGPAFLEKNQGEKLLKENSRLNEKTEPLDHFPEAKKLLSESGELPEKKKISFINKWLLRITFNGHRLIPKRLLRDLGVTSLDSYYDPESIALHRELIAVNPYTKEAVLRRLDRKKYQVLQRRWRHLFRYYRKNEKKIRNDYRNKREYLTSEAFWNSYLDLQP
jgi:GT2 family glycosyltransferase